MSKLDQAIGRLSAALEALEDVLSDGVVRSSTEGPVMEAAQRVEALEAECDRLRAEIARLERQTEEDARLREEAAEAVRAALGDLRAVIATDRAAGEEADNG